MLFHVCRPLFHVCRPPYQLVAKMYINWGPRIKNNLLSTLSSSSSPAVYHAWALHCCGPSCCWSSFHTFFFYQFFNFLSHHKIYFPPVIVMTNGENMWAWESYINTEKNLLELESAFVKTGFLHGMFMHEIYYYCFSYHSLSDDEDLLQDTFSVSLFSFLYCEGFFSPVFLAAVDATSS